MQPAYPGRDRAWTHDGRRSHEPGAHHRGTTSMQPSSSLPALEPPSNLHPPLLVITSPHHGTPSSVQGSSSRQLPGLRELLSPVSNMESPTAARYQPLPPDRGTTHVQLHPANAPSTHVPQWPQHVPYAPNPTIRSSGSDIDRSRGHAERLPPMMAPPVALRENRLQVMTADEARAALARSPGGPLAEMSHEMRRDSARSTTASFGGSTHYVGQRQIPGKGLCYVYQDGNTVPTVIDGELVNPMWGTTKAGKARKRLAQACLACREKKIRCEPRQPRCVQCEKSKRECIMPAIQQTQRDTSRASGLSSSVQAGSPIAPPNAEPRPLMDVSREPVPKRRRSMDIGTQLEAAVPGVEASSVRGEQYATPRITQPSTHSERKRDDQLQIRHPPPYASTIAQGTDYADSSAWDNEPFELDEEATMRLLDVFYAQRMVICHNVFPKRAFTRWVRTCRDKCQNESMLLYSVLALASVFAHDHSPFARCCVDRANVAVASKFGKFSLPLVLSRLYLSLLHHARGRDELGWEHSGGALRVMKVERLNTEDGCAVNIDPMPRNLFGLNNNQLAECKRRTFWTLYLMDRVSSFTAGTPCVFPSDVAYTRLPCSDQEYEDGTANNSPFLQKLPIQEFSTKSTYSFDSLSPRASLLAVAHIWTEILDFTYPNPIETAAEYYQRYDDFVINAETKLSTWRSSLAPTLQIGENDLRRSIENGSSHEILSMFAIFHMAQLSLARFVRHDALPTNRARYNIRSARTHAGQILRGASILCAYGENDSDGPGLQRLVSPLLSYTILLAIDVITAGGRLEDSGACLELSMDGLKILKVLGHSWTCSKVHSKGCERRIAELQDIHGQFTIDRTEAARQCQGLKTWRMSGPIEQVIKQEHDLIYGVDDSVFFDLSGPSG